MMIAEDWCCRPDLAAIWCLPLGLHGEELQPSRAHHLGVLPRLVPRLHPHRAIPHPQAALPLHLLAGLTQPSALQGIEGKITSSTSNADEAM